jgi:tetratricopeptide (TPR) repeat protein
MSLPTVPSPARLIWHEIDSKEIFFLTQTLPLLRASFAAAPDRLDLKQKLARNLFRTDQMVELVDWLRPIVGRKEDEDPELLYFLGRAALVTGDLQTALDALSLAAKSGFRGALGWTAHALTRLGRADEAIETALQALEDPTPDFRPLALLARLLPRRGETERLWELCADLRARGFWGGYLPAVSAFAAAAMRYDAEVAALMNPERWFSATRLALRKNFNESLSAELLANRNLTSVPSLKSTRGESAWVEDLLTFGGPLAKELLAECRRSVTDYVAQRELFAEDEIMVHRPGRVRLDSWATFLHGDGHQRWHVHPDGWISGVYYVDLPKLECTDGGTDGDIEFGLFPFNDQIPNLDSHCWRIKPEAGMLLLFPSYYAHRTWPTKVGDARLSMAFDVVPSTPVDDT